jgi:hypothetical protein
VQQLLVCYLSGEAAVRFVGDSSRAPTEVADSLHLGMARAAGIALQETRLVPLQLFFPAWYYQLEVGTECCRMLHPSVMKSNVLDLVLLVHMFLPLSPHCQGAGLVVFVLSVSRTFV